MEHRLSNYFWKFGLTCLALCKFVLNEIFLKCVMFSNKMENDNRQVGFYVKWCEPQNPDFKIPKTPTMLTAKTTFRKAAFNFLFPATRTRHIGFGIGIFIRNRPCRQRLKRSCSCSSSGWLCWITLYEIQVELHMPLIFSNLCRHPQDQRWAAPRQEQICRKES